jgi:uncharacterized membrane protein HdeD (DUF308 family)
VQPSAFWQHGGSDGRGNILNDDSEFCKRTVKMSLSDLLCATGILAVLGFLMSVIASLVLTMHNNSAVITFSIALLVCGVFKLLRSFWLKTDGKLCWSTFWTGIFCSFGG